MRGLTPSQTVGPFFAIGLDWPQANRLGGACADAPPVVIRGQLFDGAGVPVPDALLEIWQADAAGRYARRSDAAFRGAGRCSVAADGGYVFETIKPGRISAAADVDAPHINLVIFARGLLTHLYTRIYFDDEAAANAADPVLALVPAARRASLIARREGDYYRFDIHLQGASETVFFDV